MIRMKVFTIFSLVFFLMGCGNDETKEKPTNTSDNNKISEVLDEGAAKGLKLTVKSDCFTCHKLTETSIGPSYAAIAAKYKTLDQPAMDSMVKQIIYGGAGRWSTVPMTPHPDMLKEDAQWMVQYIMSIKK